MSKPSCTRKSIETLSDKVGVPITEYRGHLPIINGKRYKTFKQAYQYLYGILRSQRLRGVKS